MMMMYGNKEKLRIFRKLNNPKQAGTDLRLLAHLAPNLPELGKFGRNPERYAGDILYALLDVAEEQLVVDNRQLDEQSRETILAETAKTNKGKKQKQAQVQQPATEAKKKPSKKKRNILKSTGTTS